MAWDNQTNAVWDRQAASLVNKEDFILLLLSKVCDKRSKHPHKQSLVVIIIMLFV